MAKDLSPTIRDTYYGMEWERKMKIVSEDERFTFMEMDMTEEESRKTRDIQNKINEYVLTVRGEDGLRYLHQSCAYDIHYFEDEGYISEINADRNLIDIYEFGKTEEEAFIRAIVSFELTISITDELYNRKELNKQYSERFLDGEYHEDDYHGAFFFSEIALQDMRKYYGDNIPPEIIEYYEQHLLNVEHENYKYDYETNGFIKAPTKTK